MPEGVLSHEGAVLKNRVLDILEGILPGKAKAFYPETARLQHEILAGGGCIFYRDVA